MFILIEYSIEHFCRILYIWNRIYMFLLRCGCQAPRRTKIDFGSAKYMCECIVARVLPGTPKTYTLKNYALSCMCVCVCVWALSIKLFFHDFSLRVCVLKRFPKDVEWCCCCKGRALATLACTDYAPNAHNMSPRRSPIIIKYAAWHAKGTRIVGSGRSESYV